MAAPSICHSAVAPIGLGGVPKDAEEQRHHQTDRAKPRTHRRSKKGKSSQRSCTCDKCPAVGKVDYLDNLVTKYAVARHERVVIVEMFFNMEYDSYAAFDSVIKKLQQLDPRIIPVAYHLPQRDPAISSSPYSREKFLRRQSAYKRAFGVRSANMPQMILQGCKLRSIQCCDLDTATQEVPHALVSTKPRVAVGFEIVDFCIENRNVKALLRVNIQTSEDTEPMSGFVLTAMLTEDRLLPDSKTEFRHGEAPHHYAVVRACKERLIDYAAKAGSQKERESARIEQATLAIPLRTDVQNKTESPINIDRCRIVVTVQSSVSRRVLGANSLQLTTKSLPYECVGIPVAY